MRLTVPMTPENAARIERLRAASWRGDGKPTALPLPEAGPGRWIVVAAHADAWGNPTALVVEAFPYEHVRPRYAAADLADPAVPLALARRHAAELLDWFPRG